VFSSDNSDMEEDITIRAAHRDDIAELAALKRVSAERAYGEGARAWIDKSAGEEYFRYRIGRKDYYLWIAILDGKIIGYTGFRKRGSRADGGSVGMYTLDSGQGLGSLLQSWRERQARALGLETMRVSCWRTNTLAQRFVRKHGFMPSGGGYRESTVGVRVDHYQKAL
jgi:GNAT superfamily N-acetyltransferase